MSTLAENLNRAGESPDLNIKPLKHIDLLSVSSVWAEGGRKEDDDYKVCVMGK